MGQGQEAGIAKRRCGVEMSVYAPGPLFFMTKDASSFVSNHQRR